MIFGRKLGLGSKGNDCVAVKRALARAGFGDLSAPGTTTKLFGPFAVRNLKNFQKRYGIPASGVYGERTHNRLLRWFDAWSTHLYAEPEDKALATARAMVDFGREFDRTYRWGGEHDNWLGDDTPHDLFDCSSSTSFMLWEFHLLPISYAEVSGWFESYGESGYGKYVTVHANSEHVWMGFNLPEGYFRFDTSPHGDGSRGPRIRHSHRKEEGFKHRHPKGL